MKSICLSFSSLFFLIFSFPSLAQITSDGTLENPTRVEQQGNVIEITEGTTKGENLFHSFENFSVPGGAEAFFNNSIDITNIFSRVTGGNVSQIDGLIRANGAANLYLLNPNGMIFGENATLNLGGSLFAITGESIEFEDGVIFSTQDTQTQPLLTISVPIGIGFPENPVPIEDNSPIPYSLDIIFYEEEFNIAAENIISSFLVFSEENLENPPQFATDPITSDGTLENPTRVEQQGNVIEITEGTTRGENLFHSFEDFSVPGGAEAFFNNATDITNIFSRVTGSNISQIDGLIRANGAANLYLLNPNGMIFGENATLNLDGSLFAITGESIEFEDGVIFSTQDTQTQPLLTVSVPIGIGFPENPVTIEDNSPIPYSLDIIFYEEEFNIAAENLSSFLVFSEENLENPPQFATAPITSDGTLENSTIVNQQGNIVEITGGTTKGENLFHSFEDFSVPSGIDVVFDIFSNPTDITNIFSRVTGNNVSQIDGVISVYGAANLFLLNPNGIIFGKNSSLFIDSSLLAIAGESIEFEDGMIFSTEDTQAQPLLTVSLPVGIGFPENPVPIIKNPTLALSRFESAFSERFDIAPENLGSFSVFSGEDIPITSDGTLGNSTRIEQRGSLIEIADGTTRGNNLFHSFKDFSVPPGTEAFFNNKADITNIFGRVTGNNPSVIYGFIRVNNSANLYLLNPNGIFVGETASLDTNVLLYAISGESIVFGDGIEFSTRDPLEQPLLSTSSSVDFKFPEFPWGVFNFSVSLDEDLSLKPELAEENVESFLVLRNTATGALTINSDGTLDNPTKTEKNGIRIEITEGTTRGENLFHSFRDFSIPVGTIAFFNNQEGITNIFGRVTGDQVSNIDGFIRLNNSATLYLLNANGIVFGENATLDTNALLLAIPGESIVFEDGRTFSTKDATEQPLLTTSSPTNFVFPENPVPVEDNSLIPLFFLDEFEFFQSSQSIISANLSEENFDKILVLSGERFLSRIFDETDRIFDFNFDEFNDSSFDTNENVDIEIENITKNSEKLSTNVINTDNIFTSSCVAQTQSGSSFFIVESGGLKNHPQDSASAYFSTGKIQTIGDLSEITPLNHNQPWKIGDPIVEPTGTYRLPNGQLIISHQCKESINE